jgi:hypothetical protein
MLNFFNHEGRKMLADSQSMKMTAGMIGFLYRMPIQVNSAPYAMQGERRDGDVRQQVPKPGPSTTYARISKPW